MAKTNFGITPMQQHTGWRKYDKCRFDKKEGNLDRCEETFLK